MSKPMPRKISFSSPSTCSKGWRLPCAGALPGSVTSISSAARRAGERRAFQLFGAARDIGCDGLAHLVGQRARRRAVPRRKAGPSALKWPSARPSCPESARAVRPRRRRRPPGQSARPRFAGCFAIASFIPFSPLYVLRDEAEKEKAPPLRFDRDEAYLFVNSAVPPTFLPYDCTRANTLLFCNGNTRLCLPAATFSKATRE